MYQNVYVPGFSVRCRSPPLVLKLLLLSFAALHSAADVATISAIAVLSKPPA
jgi:hypothetical protein